MEPELGLFVIWPKGRFAEKRILDDLGREMVIRHQVELHFEGDAALAYRRFYGPALPDARKKVAKCGSGKFLLVVVEDPSPDYRTVDAGQRRPVFCNTHFVALKRKYRDWANKRNRVHATISATEFARDIALLTGFGAEAWRAGVPEGTLRPRLPDAWSSVASRADGALLPEPAPPLENQKVFLENKYINDVFYTGTFEGVPAIEKVSTKAVWSIGNEWRLNVRLYAAAPTVVPRPLGRRFAGNGSRASVIVQRLTGPSLTELLAKGLSADQADRFAADILTLAEALKATGVVHRDLFTDNLLLDADGHLKAIDWQLAIERDAYIEDPWVLRHWKFRYVVFGVNRELGLGVWNDYHALVKILMAFPDTPSVIAARARLSAEAEKMTFAAPPDRPTRLKLWFYALSLRIQMLLKGKRHRKYPQLERRWRTIKCDW